MTRMIFDTSAIVSLLEDGRQVKLQEGATISLAEYEAGNAIWKKVANTRTLGVEEGLALISALSRVLALMDKVGIGDASDVLKLALKENITYYDASFLSAAMSSKADLVTEDERLIAAAKGHVRTLKPGEV